MAGGQEAAKRMRERAERMRNHTPALKVFCAVVDKATADAFDRAADTEGRPFKRLAPSTLEARVRKVKGARRKSRRPGTKGRLTQGAKDIRTVAGKFEKPLTNTAVARNSARCRVSGVNRATWSAVGYLGPHMSGATGAGTKHNVTIPKRNPTVFDVDKDSGKARLKPRFEAELTRLIRVYVETGKAA